MKSSLTGAGNLTWQEGWLSSPGYHEDPFLLWIIYPLPSDSCSPLHMPACDACVEKIWYRGRQEGPNSHIVAVHPPVNFVMVLLQLLVNHIVFICCTRPVSWVTIGRGHILSQLCGMKHSKDAMCLRICCHILANREGSATSMNLLTLESTGRSPVLCQSSCPVIFLLCCGSSPFFTQLIAVPKSLYNWRSSQCCINKEPVWVITSQFFQVF